MKARLLSLLLLVPSVALAQTAVRGFDLERLSPDPASAHSLMVGTGDGLTRGTLRVSLLGHYEQDPLLYTRDDQRVGAVVGSRFTTHLDAAWAAFDWLELGLQLPVVVGQGGDDLSTQGVAPVPGSVLGAPVTQARFTLLREVTGNPVDLAVTVGLSLPFGSEPGLTRDPGLGMAFLPRVGAGRTVLPWLRVGAELGAVLRGQTVLTAYPQQVDDEVGSMLSLGVSAATLGDGLRGELDVRGLVPFSRTGASVEVLGGVRYPFAHAFEAFAVAGPGFGSMPGTPQFRVLGGVAWTPLAPAACLQGGSYLIAECPELDRDRDGVKNALDECPEQSGLLALRGCADRDDDGDGVLNLADACPNRAGDSAHGGCAAPDPAPAPAPEPEPAVAAAPEPAPEPAPAPAPKEEVTVSTDKLVLGDKVQFELNKTVIAESSSALLLNVVKAINAHPELKRVTIEGHSDSTGGRALNLALSRKRAEAVKAFLVQHGVDASRLEAVGLGPDRPIASNDTPEGREQNRRVEFITAAQ